MEVERVIARPPGYSALFGGATLLVSLALNAKVHNMISANGARIYLDVPRPQRDGIPFFDLEPFCAWSDGGRGGGGSARSSGGGSSGGLGRCFFAC